MDIGDWIKEWAGVLTLLVTSILAVLIFCLERKFSRKQKQRKDVEFIMDWATRILALQNEYLMSEDILEIQEKCNELLTKYFEISLLARDLDKSIYDKAEFLNEEFTRFNNQVISECLRNKIEYKEVPYSKEIQLAARDLLQESIKFRSKSEL